MTSGTLIALDLAPQICAAITRRGQILPDDVGILSYLPKSDSRLSESEVDALGALARARLPACPDWGRFFAENVGAWYLDAFASRAPDRAQAQWLIDYLGGEGAELTTAQFRLLMQVMENLESCPDELLSFARACLVRAMGAEIESRRGQVGKA
ncbi:hypothetical protein CCR94_03960 [Rhodoblastus sphagnicola]|uniref:Uncharacterized protein n=1 Tax=Rhodoblastus sphagnicola TaxID=333368 RepID=A0A2S6NDX5_9HYPH|nr:hypothetical protein [Rhodoblastus sphagnicola]MBB4198477.1 hypothetical protein [Rhodoblastus sphagnicola]PPQ32800.1 hypothetical protein CCR94_03960 [Rhodoblastus sphagnicola]